jgi:sugar phosphate isomerase/epimerase
MRLGLGSYACSWAIGVPGYVPERPLRAIDLLDRADALGVSVVQVADNLPLHQLLSAEFEAFAARAAELRIDVEVGTRGIGPGHLQTYLRLAERLGSRILRLVIDTADHHPSEDEVIDTVRAIVPVLERAGVCLAIENHDRFSARTFARIIQAVDSTQVGICLDTVNSFGALEGPGAVVNVLAPWVVNLHVKDFAISRVEHTMGFAIEGRPAGQGRLDVPWLLDVLRERGRDPNVVLELWTPPEGTLADTIAKEARWAEESVRYLRRYIQD